MTQGGQKSEMNEGAGEAEAPGDAVAGHPDAAEDARTDEGTQGPDASPQRGDNADQEEGGR